MDDALADGGGYSCVPRNGREIVDAWELAGEAFLRVRSDGWIWGALYEPLAMRALWSEPRAEKYYFATSLSVMLLERAYGGGLSDVPMRHLHRHTILTCYLDAVVDAGSLDWARGFGMAVFGLIPAPPPFSEEHSAAFREAIRQDFPRLRLMAESPQKFRIMNSLLEAASAERMRAGDDSFDAVFRYRVKSNLVCIRTFIPRLRHVMEPLAAVYSFFDDAMDVQQDLAIGQPTYMRDDASIERAEGIARSAISRLNDGALGDWSALGDVFVALSGDTARAQLRLTPAEYCVRESKIQRFVVCAAVIFISVTRNSTPPL
nr:hypothetical protein TetV2_00357 [Oceanusvirus sp.]